MIWTLPLGASEHTIRQYITFQPTTVSIHRDSNINMKQECGHCSTKKKPLSQAMSLNFPPFNCE